MALRRLLLGAVSKDEENKDVASGNCGTRD